VARFHENVRKVADVLGARTYSFDLKESPFFNGKIGLLVSLLRLLSGCIFLQFLDVFSYGLEIPVNS
jgi:hypothetical protein